MFGYIDLNKDYFTELILLFFNLLGICHLNTVLAYLHQEIIGHVCT